MNCDKLYEKFIRNITWPLWQIKDGNSALLTYLNEVNNIDSGSQKELLRSQWSKVNDILNYALKKSEFYKIRYNDFRLSGNPISYSQFVELPILTKNDIRNNSKSILVDCASEMNIFPASTGGSTGVPMKFYRDHDCLLLRKAQDLYFDSWIGLEPGMKMALFVSSSHFYGNIQKYKEKIRNATCERMLRFDPSAITDEYLHEFTGKFIKFKPKYIKSFPNSLLNFSNYVKKHNVDVSFVDAISCTGENLYSWQRKEFEDVFKCKVFERYATHECGVIASECSNHNGLHVFCDGVFTEIVDGSGYPVDDGQVGKVVVTDLYNFAFPLIRYEIGDLAIVSRRKECSCGNSLPLLREVIGRDRDIIIDSNGNPKPGYLFVEIVHKFNLDHKFQVVQLSKDKVVVRIQLLSDAGINYEKVKEEFQSLLGDKINLDIVIVEKIEREPSGKYAYVKNMMR